MLKGSLKLEMEEFPNREIIKMKYLFNFALKNILKEKRRSILTFLVLSVGIAIYILVTGMLDGFDKNSFQNFINFETGHFKIRNEKFIEDEPYDTENLIENSSKIITALYKIPSVKGVTARLKFLGEADNGEDSSPIIITGIDAKKDNTVFNLQNFISDGEFKTTGALIGQALAKELGLSKGDSVYLTLRSKDGMLTSVEEEITGIIKSTDPKTNNSSVFISLKEAQKLLDVTGVTELTIKTDSPNKVKEYQKLIKLQLKTNNISGVILYNWHQLSSDFAALMATKRKSTNVIVLFIILIAIIGIINTLLMSVYEKKKEIGTLMALGMEKKEIKNIFMFEGVIIGIVGSILGIILGTAINSYFVIHGIDYSSLIGGNNMGLNIGGVVKSTWAIKACVNSFVLVTIASLIASYYPAKKIMKMEPMECLRTVQ